MAWVRRVAVLAMTYLGGIMVVVRRDAFAGGRPADDITACGVGRPGAVNAAVRTAGVAGALARPPARVRRRECRPRVRSGPGDGVKNCGEPPPPLGG